jgi:DMSO/TMAO reductase YedYZ molybdopterin-dependent catalytic subunit
VHVGADADAQVHPTIMPDGPPAQRQRTVRRALGGMRDDGEVRTERSTAYLALAGILTGVAGIVTSQATVWALGATNSPVVAVASAVRDYTPGWLAHRLIELVGHLDKPLLVTGTVVLLVLLCGATGLLSARHPLLPDVVFFALAVIGLAAVVRLHDSGIASGLAVLVGLVTWIVTLRFLTAPLLADSVHAVPTAGAATGSTRRAFLARAGGVAVVVAFAGAAGRFASRSRRRVEQARRLLRLPVTRGAMPASADLGVPGIAPWRTPNPDFYLIHTALAAPSISPKDWQLRIHGMVEREVTVSYDDLVRGQLTESWVTLCCVSNEVGGDLIGNAWWSGVPVRDLLAQAGTSGDADAVLQTSHDGWTCGTPLTALTDDRNALLAIAMNGQPLPIDHGFPVRMVVPGLYGYVSATKWLVDLEVTRFDKFTAYWTDRGWSEKGPVKTQSRIDVPRDGGGVAAGRVRVGGSAWAQHTGIERVEYQVDGGAWRTAELGGVPSLDTWVQWSGSVDVDRGDHVLVVRATDRSGYTQTSVRADVVPDGATGWHSVSFRAH